jgi:cysteinyl-tRNA synthetase
MRKGCIAMLAASAAACSNPVPEPKDYREAMRGFVASLSAYAKTKNAGFLIVPQNGVELASEAYFAAIDGIGQESVHFSHAVEGAETNPEHRDYLLSRLKRFQSAGKRVFVTDYVQTPEQAKASARLNRAAGFDYFTATSRDLDGIPPGDAGSFLYLINPGAFASREAYLTALEKNPAGFLIVDAGFAGADVLSAAEVARLKRLPSGGARTVIAYLSVGEAETYRSYWNPAWKRSRPEWLAEENPEWAGNVKVRYWHPAWRTLVFGTPESALDRILAAGFDGAYLDIVDAFHYFEKRRAKSGAS